MKKHFYTHIIDTSTLSLELGEMDLTSEERIHLFSLIDANIHHTILDLVLSELSFSLYNLEVFWLLLYISLKMSIPDLTNL